MLFSDDVRFFYQIFVPQIFFSSLNPFLSICISIFSSLNPFLSICISVLYSNCREKQSRKKKAKVWDMCGIFSVLLRFLYSAYIPTLPYNKTL